MTATPAYLTDPGFSLPSLLANLPYFLNYPDNQTTPVILMDTHDYDRLRARTLREKSNEKIQYLGWAYEELRRRDILHTVNYAKLYPPDLQQDILEHSRRIIEETPYEEHQEAAVQGIKGLEKYGWGEPQKSFRSNLGEDTTSLARDRKGLNQQRDKMEQGCGNPAEWNQNVLNEYMTALKIRFRANHALDFEVQGVIGQGDYKLLSGLLNTPRSQRIIDDMTENEGFDPKYMIGFDPKVGSQTREMLDYVGERAAEVARVQYDDWSFLGSTLAIPKLKNTDNHRSDFDYIQSEIRRGIDEETLVEEAKMAKSIIKRRSAESPSLNQAQYEADWAAEQHGLVATSGQHQALTETFYRGFNLADYSREIQELNDQDSISSPALFVAASALSDPTQQSEKNLHQRVRDLLGQFGQPSITEAQLETYSQRGDYLRGETSDSAPDWFEDTDRQR